MESPPPPPQPSLPPPGWHDDPQDPTSLRYWDGTTWTDNRAPKPTIEQPKNPSNGWTPQRIAAAIGAAAIVVGSFSPWLTVTSGFGSVSLSGTDDQNDGVITLIAGLIVLALIVAAKYVAAIVINFLTAAVLIIDLVDALNKISDNDEEFVRVSVGWGLWVATIGAVVAFVATILHKRSLSETPTRPSAPESPQAN